RVWGGVVVRVASDTGGDNDQGLVTEVGEHRGLCSGGIGLDELVDPAGGVVGGCILGADLGPRLRRQIAVAEAPYQPRETETRSQSAEGLETLGGGIVGTGVV